MIFHRSIRGNYMRLIKILMLSVSIVALSGCYTVGNVLNPFYEPPTEEALKGEKTDRALNEGEGKVDKAREALEATSSYQRAHAPQPYNPVMQPAVVRLMWVPDRLNKHGDLVPAHYYYLKVLADRWAVQDAFELEAQLSPNGSASGNLPYTTKDDPDASK